MAELSKAANDGSLLLVGLTVIILFLLFACGVAGLLLREPAPRIVAPQEIPEEPYVPPANVPNISAEDLSFWESITIENVQIACLAKAREEAGDNADLVYGCICTESASSSRKRYECDIRTADPFTDYFADIDCSLDGRMCSVESNYGTSDLTFAELMQYYG